MTEKFLRRTREASPCTANWSVLGAGRPRNVTPEGFLVGTWGSWLHASSVCKSWTVVQVNGVEGRVHWGSPRTRRMENSWRRSAFGLVSILGSRDGWPVWETSIYRSFLDRHLRQLVSCVRRSYTQEWYTWQYSEIVKGISQCSW